MDFVGGIKMCFMKTIPIRFNIQCHVSKMQLNEIRMRSVPRIFFIISLRNVLEFPFFLFCRFHSQIYCRFFYWIFFSFIFRVRKSSHLSFSFNAVYFLRRIDSMYPVHFSMNQPIYTHSNPKYIEHPQYEWMCAVISMSFAYFAYTQCRTL